MAGFSLAVEAAGFVFAAISISWRRRAVILAGSCCLPCGVVSFMGGLLMTMGNADGKAKRPSQVKGEPAKGDHIGMTHTLDVGLVGVQSRTPS